MNRPVRTRKGGKPMRYELLIGVFVVYVIASIALRTLVKIQSNILSWYIPYVLGILFLISWYIMPQV